MTSRLDDRVAVVTGGSSGIGLAIAMRLSELGCRVVVSARSAERLREAAAGLPGPAEAVVADVTDPDAAATVIRVAEERFGPVDIVVANAGIYVAGDVWTNDAEDIEHLIRTNVGGILRTVRVALPSMIARGAGDVLITGSVSGTQVIPWEPVYSASKHALQAFAHGVRQQLTGTGVRLGIIGPGVVLNALWSVSDETAITEGIAAGTGIRSEDVADAAAFMLTRPRHVTVRDLVILPSNQQI